MKDERREYDMEKKTSTKKMTPFLVPYDAPFGEIGPDDLSFQKDRFKLKRKQILREIRCLPGILELVKNLEKDTLYKIVMKPDGAKLLEDASGNIMGVFREKGKILQHARLKRVQPSILETASPIASQILLVGLAMQLNRIETSIGRVIEGQQDDRMALIEAGIEQYRQAMDVRDLGRQERLIEDAIQTLNTGLKQTLSSLKRQIENAPDPKISFPDNWVRNKSEVAKEKLALAEESFQMCLIGLKTLALCYEAGNERLAAVNLLKRYFGDLKETGIATAAEKARLIQYDEDKPPEAPWKAFLALDEKFQNDIESYLTLANKEFDSIEFKVEFKPEELMRDENTEL